jgi:hypothetical protein
MRLCRPQPEDASMSVTPRVGVPLIALGLALAGCQQQAEAPAGDAAPAAAVAALPTPPFSVNRQMVSLVDNEAHVLWGAEREGAAPQSDADWNTIEDHALQIVAAGYLVARGGTGPEDARWSAEPVWQEQSKALIEAAMAAATAADAKSMKDLLAANGKLVDSCLACHEAFKPAIPTEGRTHQHADEFIGPLT